MFTIIFMTILSITGNFSKLVLRIDFFLLSDTSINLQLRMQYFIEIITLLLEEGINFPYL